MNNAQLPNRERTVIGDLPTESERFFRRWLALSRQNAGRIGQIRQARQTASYPSHLSYLSQLLRERKTAAPHSAAPTARTRVRAGTRVRTGTRGRMRAAAAADNNKNINNTTDENSIKQVNRERGSEAPPPAPNLSLGFVLANAPGNVPPEFVRYWFGEMGRRGWQMRDGRTVNAANWKYSLGSYYAHASDDERERIRRETKAGTTGDGGAARGRTRPHDWRLCAERCANCRADGGCVRGVSVPPAWQPRPVPPEECPHFAAQTHRFARGNRPF